MKDDLILNHVSPRTPAMSEADALLAELGEEGVDLQAAQASANQEEKDALAKQYAELEQKRQVQAGVAGAYDAAAGVGTGVRKVAENIYNGALGLMDSVENYAASKGYGTGELIQQSQKIDITSDLEKGLDTPGKVTKQVTQFVAPLVATMGVGGSFAAGVGVNAAYNFLAIDPKDPRIADALKDTSFSEVPVAAQIIDGLSTKPDDTELESRFKNMMEGLALDVTLGGIVYSGSRIYSGVTKLRNPKVLREAEKEIAMAPKAAAAVETPPAAQVVEGQPVLPKVGEQAPKVEPQKPIVEVMDDEQLSLFEKEWAKMEYGTPSVTITDDAVRLRLTDDQIVDRFVQISEQNPGPILRTPLTDQEVISAAEILRKDPAVIDRLANWKQGDGVITDKDTMVMKYIMERADDSMMDAATLAAANINDDVSMIKFFREFENYTRILKARTGMASAKGATLRAEQILGHMAAMGDKEAIMQIGAQGRANLVDKLLESYGGKTAVQGMANDVNFLKDLSKIAERPNADFAMRMGQVVELSTYQKLNQAVTKVALNGMLSSPMTPFKAIITNAATTAKTAIDNYVAVGVGGVRGMLTGNQYRQTLAEANAQMIGMVQGLVDNIKPALQGDKVYRIDLAQGRQKILGYDDAMFNATGAWVKAGMAVERAVEAPTRALMSVDAYWHGVNTQGFVRGEAISRAVSMGLKDEAKLKFVQDFMSNPPKDVLYNADKVALANTMAKELEGVALRADQMIEEAGQFIPLARVVLPFFKTNANLIDYTVKNSPLAFMAPSVRKALMAGGREADQAIAKITTGSVAMGLLTYMAHTGVLIGQSLDPKRARATQDNKGVPQDSSIKVGDTWVSLKGLEPISTFVNVASLMNKASGHIGQDEYAEAATATAMIAADIMTPEQLMNSIAGLVEIALGKKNAVDSLAQFPSRLMPFGALAQDMEQTIDPKNRVVKGQEFYETMLNNFKNKIPGLSKDLPGQRNIWGESISVPDGIGIDAISPFATSDGKGLELKNTLEAMDDYYETHKTTNFGLYKLDISMPSKTIPNAFASSVPYELSPKEHEVYILMSAGIDPFTGKELVPGRGTLKQVVEKAVKQYIDPKVPIASQDPMSYAKAVAEIQGTITAYRTIANSKIVEYGLVGSKMGEAAQKFKTLEMGGN